MLSYVSAYNGGTLTLRNLGTGSDARRVYPKSQSDFVRAIPWEVQHSASANRNLNFKTKRCCDPVTTEDSGNGSNEMATCHHTPTPLFS